MPKPNADDFLELSVALEHLEFVKEKASKFDVSNRANWQLINRLMDIGDSLKELENESDGTDARDE